MNTSGSPPVEITFVAIHPERPPKVRLHFDVTLRNDRGQPRWFLLPDKITASPEEPGYRVDEIATYELSAPPNRVVAGCFGGPRGFKALLLLAGAEVKLLSFPITLWSEEIPDSVGVEVVLASQLAVGGKPAEDWLGTDPVTYALQAEVRADTLADKRRALRLTHTPDYQVVSVSMVEDRRVELQVDLGRVSR